MHRAKKHLLYTKSISNDPAFVGVVTYREILKNDIVSINREDIIKKNLIFEFFEFENIPLSGWKIDLEYIVPFGNSYYQSTPVITHPNFPFIRLELSNFNDLLFSSTIVNGIIQDKIILVVNNINQIYAYSEGSLNYDFYIHNMELSPSIYSKQKDLSVGDVVIYDSSFTPNSSFSHAIYLGKSYVSVFNHNSNGFSFNNLNTLYYFFLEFSSSEIRIVCNSSLLRLQILANDDRFKDFNCIEEFNNSIFKNKDLEIFGKTFVSSNYSFFSNNKELSEKEIDVIKFYWSKNIFPESPYSPYFSHSMFS